MIIRGLMAAGAAIALAATGLLPARSAGGNVHSVEIRRFKFIPANLTAVPGDRITFTNHDIAPHTATAQDGSWDTGALKRGQQATITVGGNTSGDYFCRFHPVMKGKLTISSSS